MMVKANTINIWRHFLTNFKNWANTRAFAIQICFLPLSINGMAQVNAFKIYESKQILDANCQLGEGSFWDSKRKILWFVDIEKGYVHSFEPNTKRHFSFSVGQKIGTLVPSRESDRLVLGLQDGIYKSDFGGKDIQKLASIKELNSNQRLNDGKCDPAGRFWVGGLNTNKKSKESHLFMMDKDNAVSVKLDSISISNGIVWSRNGEKMFYIDTPTRTVQSFDFEGNTGRISNRKVIIQTPDSLGWPDGMTIDENDNLYIGMWGGKCVSIWSSRSGAMLGKVNVDAKNVTSCAFGGEDGKTLYITTAKQGLSKEELEKYPLSGNLFKAEMDVKGNQMHYWK